VTGEDSHRGNQGGSFELAQAIGVIRSDGSPGDPSPGLLSLQTVFVSACRCNVNPAL